MHCCDIPTSNTWAGSLIPVPKMCSLHLCSTKGTEDKSWIFFRREWGTCWGRRMSGFEHWGEVVALWVLGWFGVNQKSHSVRMLCNCINMHLTTRYYHERVTEKSHEDIVYSVWGLNSVLLSIQEVPGLRRIAKLLKSLTKNIQCIERRCSRKSSVLVFN